MTEYVCDVTSQIRHQANAPVESVGGTKPYIVPIILGHIIITLNFLMELLRD